MSWRRFDWCQISINPLLFTDKTANRVALGNELRFLGPHNASVGRSATFSNRHASEWSDSTRPQACCKHCRLLQLAPLAKQPSVGLFFLFPISCSVQAVAFHLRVAPWAVIAANAACTGTCSLSDSRKTSGRPHNGRAAERHRRG